jgi:hypothetical protein
MKKYFVAALVFFLGFPAVSFAADAPASFTLASSLVATSSAPGNAYLFGRSIIVTAPTMGDLSALGWSIVSAGRTYGDGFLMGGSISSRAPVEGDLRAVGGSIHVQEDVLGDLVALGYRVSAPAHVGASTLVAGLNVSLTGGASGPVTIYGNNVLLAGTFANNVNVVATGVVTLDTATVIRGKLVYESPDLARIPDSARLVGGVERHNSSYLPDVGTSRALAFASIAIFILVRIVGALILAGLLAGLFPALAEHVADRATHRKIRTFFVTTLLGFAVLVATPILCVMLALTFVGLGLAVLIGILYVLLLVLAVLYAGILVGMVLMRRLFGRRDVRWHEGVIGMLALSLVALVPGVGPLIAFVLTAFAAGTLFLVAYRFAFPHDELAEEVV